MSSSIWVDKYRPQSSNDLVGQNRNVARIKSWLKTYEPSRSRPLFIYGPPGIGKTTAAHLCCKEMGFQTVEFNASDQRNKNIIKDVISTVCGNSRLNFFGRASETKDAIILDEVDGMAGNEDRGGIAQLILEMKNTKKPMIFICNDGQHQKLRSLKDKCETLEFRRPEFEAIRMVVTKIARKEGLNIDKINIKQLAESSDYDIRQIVNSLSLFRDGSVEEVAKTTRLNAFEASRKALTASRLSINDRFECFFADYNIMSLFVFENYFKNKPARGDQLEAVARAAHSMSLSDIADKQIRSNQNWSLLNVQALLSTVIPTSLVASHNVGRVDFPQFLGKLSNANKRLRLQQELNAHMCLSLRGGLNSDYLDVMRERLSAPLIKKELGGVEAVLDFMQDYSLLRDDLNSIMELATWSFKPDPMSKVDSKTKTALTLAYKKRSIALPYFVEDGKAAKKRKHAALSSQDGDIDEEEEEDEEEEVIKPKRVVKNEKPKKETQAHKKNPKEKAVKEDDASNGKPKSKPRGKATVKVDTRTGSNGTNGKATTVSPNSSQDDDVMVITPPPKKNDPKQTAAPANKPDKRPPEGGIARFFLQPKKQKSS